jgi:mRNA deadenylase 3'-5' endonuclease subunit Ccr4
MSFSVASYNILADAYLRREWYPHIPESVLDPQRRRAALVRHIEGLIADVICLQEVEPAAFTAIAASLQLLGYQAHYAPKGAGRPDGCATLIRENAFTVRARHDLRYADGWGTRPDSGHVALVLVLEREGRVLGVANTHLRWDSPGTRLAEQWAYRQITQLLESRKGIDPQCPAWIFCGDFNITPDSAVVRMLEQAGFLSAYRGQEHRSPCVANGKARMIDYLFHTAALESRPVDLPAIDDRAALPSLEEPSDHLPIMAWFVWREVGDGARA